MSNSAYATPRLVTDIGECFFYHTMDIPEYGLVKGKWDLRGRVHQYLGGVDFGGKRVLEIGTADGFLCFQMEQMGARVICYDLSEQQFWDIVPYAGDDLSQIRLERQDHIRKINNAYWFCHRMFRSNAQMVYGTTYEIPQTIGLVDISTFGAVLLHVRDPFLALQNALRLTRDTVIVTEPVWKRPLLQHLFARLVSPRFLGEDIVFVPDFRKREPKETWWILSPGIIKRFVGVLGFEDTRVTYHSQKFEELGEQNLVPYYTIVAHRTRGIPS